MVPTDFCVLNLYVFTCAKLFRPSDDVSLAGYEAWYSEKGIFMRFRNSVRSWCEICQLIVVWSSGLQQWKDIEVAEGFCSEVGKDAKNVGKEFAARENENCRNSASVVTDNHPVGSRCLDRTSVAWINFENAKM